MKRLTKAHIDADLLAGKGVPWKGPTGKTTELQLETPGERRLYDFLRGSSVRDTKAIPQTFIDGLWSAYSEGDDPAAIDATEGDVRASAAASWRIKRLQTKNFGGINAWDGPDFIWNLDSESWHLEGENGSGKSSLLSAIVFAFTGRRPRDNRDPEANLESTVFDAGQKKLGSWPPLASYPDTTAPLQTKPSVRAMVTLESSNGEVGEVGHGLTDGKIISHRKGLPGFDDVFISTGILMPVMLSALRLGEGDDGLRLAVEQLTGLDTLKEIGELCASLTHSAREYRSYAKKNNLDILVRDFEAEVKSATDTLSAVGVETKRYVLEDAKTNEDSLVALGVQVKQEAATHSELLKDDLEEG